MYTVPVWPKKPTVLDELTVKLPGYELWMTMIKNVHVIPTRLNVPRFIHALEEALQVYPHLAGQLRRSQGEWEIIPSPSPIVVEVDEREDETMTGLDGRWVVQSNLRPFLRTGRSPSDYSRDATFSGEADRLVFIKLTMSRQETAVGISWHHTLGDATVLCRFMKVLSDRYQDIRDPPSPIPTFTKPQFRLPDELLVKQYAPLMPHLANACPVAEPGQRYGAMYQSRGMVNFRITTEQLRKLRERISLAEDSDPDDRLRPSLLDCLAAYIITVLNRYLDIPITQVYHAASYRSVPGVTEDSVAGNAIYIIPTTLNPKNSVELSLRGIAYTLRQSISTWQEGPKIKEYMSVASHLMQSAVNEGHSMSFARPPGHISVNSNIGIDWHAAHFGFAEKSRFYTFGIDDRYVRVFSSNPDEAGSGESSLDVVFAVARNVRNTVHEAITLDLQAPNFPENLL